MSYYGYGGGGFTSGQSTGNFEPVGRPGQYFGEQQKIGSGTWTWIATRQRWELSGGQEYNDAVTKSPQQVRQDVLASGGSQEEADAAAQNQVIVKTNPTQNYLFNQSTTTGAGTVIRDVQSEVGALEQIVNVTDEGTSENIRATNALLENDAYQATDDALITPENGYEIQPLIVEDDDIIDEILNTPPDPVVIPQPDPVEAPQDIPKTNNSSNTDWMNFGVVNRTNPSNLYKKIDTDNNNVTISNTYPQEEDRNLTSQQFLSGVRTAYQGRGTSNVSHTATSMNGGTHTNTVNEKSKLFTQNMSVPRPQKFGDVGTNYQSYNVVEKNLEGRDTSLRFFLMFEGPSNNVYMSKQLKLDLDAARRNGNPYFTEHLIPVIKANKNDLNRFMVSFRAKEQAWKNFSIGIGLSAEVQNYSLDYLPITDSLGTEGGKVGEVEVFKYLDSLIKSPPTGDTARFIQPYRKGTVIGTWWFSQNPPGFGYEPDDDAASLSERIRSARGAEGEVNVVTANTGEDITVVGDTLDLTLGETADLAADIGSGNYDGTTTTGVLDNDGDGTADSVANFADELEDSDGDGIFDAGAAGILTGNLGGGSSGGSTSTSSGNSSGGSSNTSTGTSTTPTKNPNNLSTEPIGYAGSNNQRINYQGEVWVWNDNTGWQIEGGFETFGGGTTGGGIIETAQADASSGTGTTTSTSSGNTSTSTGITNSLTSNSGLTSIGVNQPNTNLSPFGVSGTFNGQTRVNISDGKTYVWNQNNSGRWTLYSSNNTFGGLTTGFSITL